MKAFEEARKKATDDDNPDKKPMREILSKRVDTKVSIENGTKVFEFNQSQLFSAVESAIFRVFGNTNLAGVSSKRKNSIEYVWWNAQLMFGYTCKLYGFEREKNETVGCFSALRKKKQSAMTNLLIKPINHAWRQTRTPVPTQKEVSDYLTDAGIVFTQSNSTVGKKDSGGKKSTPPSKVKRWDFCVCCKKLRFRRFHIYTAKLEPAAIPAYVGKTVCHDCFEIRNAPETGCSNAKCRKKEPGRWVKKNDTWFCKKCATMNNAIETAPEHQNGLCFKCGKTSTFYWVTDTSTGRVYCEYCSRKNEQI